MSSAAPLARSPALRSFEAQWRARATKGQPPKDSLDSLRAEAMQRFLTLGLPGQRDESWRHTSLRGLEATRFGEFADGEVTDARAPAHSAIVPLSFLDLRGEFTTVVLVNGSPVLSGANLSNNNNIIFNKLRDKYQEDPSLISRLSEPLSNSEQRRWSLLNTALFDDGLHIKIDGPVATPVLLIHVNRGGEAPSGEAVGGEDWVATHPRVIIEAAAGARATIIEHHVGALHGTRGGPKSLCNSATHLSLGENAELEHYRVFSTSPGRLHFDTLDIHQSRDSRCTQFTVTLGGGLVRTLTETHLDQPGAAFDNYSLLVGHEARHVDCVNVAVHAAPHTHSRQTARAIASGTSRVIFNSKVVVNPGAVQAESLQSCRGLLLSPTAEIDTRPQLEIHADEVKCAHGATTGRLDPDMLFYMLSRGLDRATAQSLLIYAFLDDVLTGMSLRSVRSAIEGELIAQLPDSELLKGFR
jgi:Fe-S cluster assembly protein SufD